MGRKWLRWPKNPENGELHFKSFYSYVKHTAETISYSVHFGRCKFTPFFPLPLPFFLFYFSLLFLKGAETPSGSTWRSTAIFKMALHWSQKRWARFFFGILLLVLGIGENRYARTVSIHYIMEYVLHLLIIYILFCISEKDIKMDAL